MSFMLFSRDDLDKAASLIKDLYDVVDQVVLIDSSSESNFRKFEAEIKKERLRKVALFRAIALGYADPLRMFALHKCRYDWVLYLGTDERINDALKRDMKRIISRTATSAFAIKRFEEAQFSGKASPFFTWQIGLYDKRAITYKGIVHEQPIVDGTIERLDERYSIIHVTELKGSAAQEYGKMSMFERFSYDTFNERILDYASKMHLSAQQNIKETLSGRLIYGLLRTYETLTLRKMDREISNFDYFTLFFLKTMIYQIKMRSFSGVAGLLPNALRYVRTVRELRSAKNGDAMFQISRKIEKIGIIEYLALDKDRTIEVLNRKYAKEKQGVGLLMKLLEDKYYGRYP